jgi:hypothetical protein
VYLRLCKLQKGCTRLAAASDKVYQLLAHGWWFSPGTSASSTIKTARQKHQKSNHLTYLIKIFFAHIVFLLMQKYYYMYTFTILQF